MTVGVAGIYDGQLVGVLSNVRKVVGNELPAFTAPAKRTPFRSEIADFTPSGVDVFPVGGQLLAGVLCQLWLMVERVDLAWCSVHCEEDARFRLCRKMLSDRSQRSGRCSFFCSDSSVEKTVSFEQ